MAFFEDIYEGWRSGVLSDSQLLTSIAISLKRMADAAERANQILSEQLASERDPVQEEPRNGTGSRTDGEGNDSLNPIEKDRC